MATVVERTPVEAVVAERIEESATVFTLRLRFADPAAHGAYRFAPGQFNMLYLYGVGEVPISIVSDQDDRSLFDHTIRAVGRVTQGLAQLKTGDRLGIRGPYGHGWPLDQLGGRDIVLVSGGLGCAPTVSVIHHVLARRAQFGRLVIIQGVKHADDLIWRERYQAWAQVERTQVLLAADVGGPLWPGHVGQVTSLFERARFDPARAAAMMCGPEAMMRAAAAGLVRLGVPETEQWLSMERSMQCALGHCGHCQFGAEFVCRDGPVFNYARVKPLFGVRGF